MVPVLVFSLFAGVLAVCVAFAIELALAAALLPIAIAILGLGSTALVVLVTAYRMLFAVPVGIGLMQQLLCDKIGWGVWGTMTETTPWCKPFETNDSVFKFVVFVALQPIYWALALLAVALFLVASISLLAVVLITGMVLYATRLLALKPVQAVWIRVWTLDETTELPYEPDESSSNESVLLVVAFKQMLVSELIFESIPELVVQFTNNQIRDAWSLLAILSFAVTAIIVVDAAYRYMWFLLIRGIFEGRTWDEAWSHLPLFSANDILFCFPASTKPN